MGFLQEFKEFAVKGNAVDMAVGIIVRAAFNKIISSLVNDVIMPPIGLLLGGVDFKNLELVLKEASVDAAGARGDVAVRAVYQHCDRFSDCGFHNLHGDQSAQSSYSGAPGAGETGLSRGGFPIVFGRSVTQSD